MLGMKCCEILRDDTRLIAVAIEVAFQIARLISAYYVHEASSPLSIHNRFSISIY